MSGWFLAALVTLGWTVGWWLLWRVPGLDHGEACPSRAGSSDVAVIIPARNEARSLPLLLDDLAQQSLRPAEIVVVDDASEDDTVRVATLAGATVVRTGGPPPGWAGKPWACGQGVRTTTAGVLVFLDADVRLAPDVLERLVATHERTGGLLSVQPHHVVGRPIEGFSMTPNIVVLAGTGAFMPVPTRPALAFGPCLVCERRQYEAVGGHAAVRAAVAEDAALARLFRAADLDVALRAGDEAVTFRMYPDGVRPLLQGWSKNLAIGARAAPPIAASLSAVWVAALLATPALTARLALSDGRILLAAVVYAAMTLEVGWMGRRAGRFGRWPIVLFPISATVFVTLFAWSTIRIHVLGSVRWRGRRIAVDEPR
jgi:4,4'-diaponeurosporenoate glycosyltransferase